MPTFVDMFAGAGGFSEGFLQAEDGDNYFDFLLAGDINPTCEVTHRMRYNEQLNLSTEFLTKDITSPDYIEELCAKIENNYGKIEVDVLTGGPPCQSFSLAGERRKNDKKDDLFSYYLKVIEAIKPKYFVMENVAGILTKDNGKIKERILREIRNIADYDALQSFITLCDAHVSDFMKLPEREELFMALRTLKISLLQHQLETERREDYLALVRNANKLELSDRQKAFYQKALLENKNEINNPELELYCNELANRFVEAYRNNKEISEDERNVIRQALLLISHQTDLMHTKEKVKYMINASQLKRSTYKTNFDAITDYLSLPEIVEIASNQCNHLISITDSCEARAATQAVRLALDIMFEGVCATIERMKGILAKHLDAAIMQGFDARAEKVALYRINAPITLLASDYGVPQNRVRVVFIGCRNDQKLITEIPATVDRAHKVTAAEAIGDLNYIGIGDHPYDYDKAYRKAFEKTTYGNILRSVDGALCNGQRDEKHHTFSEWSRIGRLNPKRFPNIKEPAYTAANCYEEYHADQNVRAILHNHETSKHSKEVQDRYALMRKHGDYHTAKERDPENPLLQTKKRNYACLSEDKPSTTIVTLGDDFAHYGANRSLTVREMARLQSFDDSFVFQGKRSTGGDKRKMETPQFTQVGNAVPPLMARAIAMQILKSIN